jgi:hypothetical protein
VLPATWSCRRDGRGGCRLSNITGENIGDTPTHVLFVELKQGAADGAALSSRDEGDIGPEIG